MHAILKRMKIFLDACTLFDAQEDIRVYSLLRRVKNTGNELLTSITVLGEILALCLDKQDRDMLHGITGMLSELDVKVAHSVESLRNCCLCIEENDPDKRFSPNDKTHAAYALVYGCDIFLTTDGDMNKHFSLIEGCPLGDNLRILNYEGLRKVLAQKA